jgi:hypothetical protein
VLIGLEGHLMREGRRPRGLSNVGLVRNIAGLWLIAALQLSSLVSGIGLMTRERLVIIELVAQCWTLGMMTLICISQTCNMTATLCRLRGRLVKGEVANSRLLGARSMLPIYSGL